MPQQEIGLSCDIIVCVQRVVLPRQLLEQLVRARPVAELHLGMAQLRLEAERIEVEVNLLRPSDRLLE